MKVQRPGFLIGIGAAMVVCIAYAISPLFTKSDQSQMVTRTAGGGNKKTKYKKDKNTRKIRMNN